MSRRKPIVRNKDAVFHLDSVFSFSKHFALLFESHENSMKMWGWCKCLYFSDEETEARM